MDLKRLNRIITTSGIAFYSVDVILAMFLYTLLDIFSLFFPGSEIIPHNFTLNALVISVPLISGMFDGLILAMIIMSLKYAEYYGIGKSAITFVIYIVIYIVISHYANISFVFTGREAIYGIIFTLIALSVLQIIVMYFYARLQREMFG